MLIQMAAGCAYAVGPFARELKLQFFLGRAISIDYVGDISLSAYGEFWFG
jgi:hypothetical protein